MRLPARSCCSASWTRDSPSFGALGAHPGLGHTASASRHAAQHSLRVEELMKASRFGIAVSTLMLLVSSEAAANTLNQNVSWTINRANTAVKYRVVAYGDSIFAGYNGSTYNVARYSAPTVDAEYLSAVWNADIETVRRTKSGAVASDIYKNKIVAERSYMQASTTCMVMFEMCGNDALQARSSFKAQTGTCNYGVLATAEKNCRDYVGLAMDYMNWYAYAGTKAK